MESGTHDGAPGELERLRGRLTELARQKSYLQLSISLMDRLNALPGLESTIGGLLRVVGESLGGTHVSLHYFVGQEIHYADVRGRREQLEGISDALVAAAQESGRPEELLHDFRDTLMETPEFTRASTCAVPLVVAGDSVGVLKIEGAHISIRGAFDQLRPFFCHAALILRSEISGYESLRRAYDDLSVSHARLAEEALRRGEAEEALLQERVFTQALLESIPDGVVACDARGTLALFNRAAREWHGGDASPLPREEWPQRYDLYHADGATPLSADEVPLARAHGGETLVDAGMAIAATGMPPRYILANGSPIRDEAGRCLGAVVVMRDVTELRRMEAELRQANEELERRVAQRTSELQATSARLSMELDERIRTDAALRASERALRTLIENVPDCIARFDLEGRCVYLSPTTEIAFGAHREDLLDSVRAADGDPPDLVSAVRSVIADGAARRVDVLRDAGEGLRVFEMQLVAEHDEAGAVTSVLGIARDVTAARESERERLAHLRYLEGMELVNRALAGPGDLQQVVGDALETVLSILDCDRAYLLYPCDPSAPTWSVPMERTRPGYPGAHAHGLALAMEPQDAQALRALRDADGPLRFGPGGDLGIPTEVAERFGVQSFLAMALWPKIGSPWQFGVHQCSRPRLWSVDDARLFEAVGRRLADALSSLLAERDLRQSETLFREVFEHMASGIAIYEVSGDGEDFVYRDINPAGASIGHREREDHLGRSVLEVYPGIRDTGLLSVLQGVWHDGLPRRLPIRAHKDGHIAFWTENYVCRLPAGQIVAVYEDRTAEKRAEEAARQAAESYRIVADNTHAWEWWREPDGSFRYCSPSCERITGLGPEAFLDDPTTLQAIIHPDDRAAYARHADEADNSRQYGEMEFRIVRPDGEVRWIQHTCQPVFGPDGAFAGTRGSNRDATAQKRDEEERRRLESQVQRSQRLESIGVMAGGIAHDFNNVLAGIMGFAEMAVEELRPDSKAAHHLEHVLEGSGRARDLVQQILTFCRQTPMERRPVLLHLVVNEALRFLRASLPATVEIVREVSHETGPVLADATQIHQVIVNLCTNAEYAMRPGGGTLRVSLTTEQVDERRAEALGGLEAGRYAVLSVADTGCGMDAVTLERIFDPFFTTKPTGEGTGLGLATTYGIVTGHAGAIAAYSEVGRGTVFHVYLPCAPALEVGTSVEASGAPRGAEHLVFVDDEPLLVSMAHGMLTSLGYSVTAVADSEEALGILRADPSGVDLLVTDHTMPALTGLDLAEEVHAIRPDLPVLLMTGFRQNVDTERAEAAAIEEIIDKPYGKQALAEAVRRALDRAKGDSLG